MICWLRWRETSRRTWQVASLAQVVLAMISKEDAITLPAIIVTLDLAVHGWRGRRTVWDYLPLAAWFAAYAWIETVAYQHCTYFKFVPNAGADNNVHVVVWFEQARALWYLFGVPLVATGSYFNAGVALAVGAGTILLRLRRHKLLLAMFAALLLAALPNPVLVGAHANTSRFYYLPELYASLFWVTIIARGLASHKTSTRAAAIALITAAVAKAWSVVVPPEYVAMGASVAVVVLLAAARSARRGKMLLLMLAAAAFVSVMQAFGLEWIWMALALGVPIILVVSWGASLDDAIDKTVAFYYSATSFPLCLVQLLALIRTARGLRPRPPELSPQGSP
jgi:hypothetical protein